MCNKSKYEYILVYKDPGTLSLHSEIYLCIGLYKHVPVVGPCVGG